MHLIIIIDRNELELRTQLALNKALEARAPPTQRTATQSRSMTSQQSRKNEQSNQLNDDQVITTANDNVV